MQMIVFLRRRAWPGADLIKNIFRVYCSLAEKVDRFVLQSFLLFRDSVAYEESEGI
jgi:hypothetical protein